MSFSEGNVPKATDAPTQSLQKINALQNADFNVVESASLIEVATAVNGTSYTAFPSTVCKQLTIPNTTGTSLTLKRSGSTTVLVIPSSGTWSFRGLANASEVTVRRTDTSTTPVTVVGEPES